MTRRISLFAMVLTLFGAVIGDAQAQTCPLLPSPVIPSQRPWGKALSNGKGAEPQAQQLYNSGDPSQDEQYYLEMLNRARMSPPAAGVEISKTTDPDVSFEFTYWAGQDANEPTRARIKFDFATYQPKQPLAMNASLLTAARAHSQDMLDSNYQGHQGTDGSWPVDRAKKAGYPSLFGGTPYVGENAAAYAKSVYDAYAGWLIDFGVPNDTQYGHRNNCLEFETGSDSINPGYTECGPGMIHDPGEGYPTHTGPLVSTLDLGDAGKHFILGVVYNDLNKNGLYDPGEGISGVRIDVNGAAYYAVSATQGGYAIPYSGANGTVTVTASGGSFPTPVTKTIDFEGQNIKVDFNPDLTGYPTQVTLALPVADTTVNADSVTFTWDSVALAQSYHIEIGTDSLFKSAIAKNDSGLKTIYFAFGVLKDSTTYYWRAQAKNAKGVGPWSATQAFSVGLSPSPVALVFPTNGSNVGNLVPRFFWHVANKGAQSYSIVISSKITMSDTVWSDNTTDTTDQPLGANFTAGPTFYWTVSAYNDFGWGRPSAPGSLTFSPLSVTAANTAAESISISPNPTSGAAHIHFTLSASQDVSLHLFNSVGDEVKSVALGTRSAGLNEFDFDGSSLAAGTYSFELRVGNRTETGRIVLIK